MPVCLFAIGFVITFGLLHPSLSTAEDGLAISVERSRAIDAATKINLEEPLRVVFAKKTGERLVIWHPFSKEGYGLLQFEFRDLTTGEEYRTARSPISDPPYFEAVGNHKTVVIEPHDTFSFSAEFTGIE